MQKVREPSICEVKRVNTRIAQLLTTLSRYSVYEYVLTFVVDTENDIGNCETAEAEENFMRQENLRRNSASPREAVPLHC